MFTQVLPLILTLLIKINGLIDENNVSCERLNDCALDLESESSRDIYFGLKLSYPDPQQRVSFVGAFDDGHDIAPAAYLAVEQINNRTDVLCDYNIKLIRADGGCNVTERSVIGMNEICCSCKPIMGIIGPSCGTASMVISQLAGKQQFSMVTIHYGQREILGNRTLFPFAFGILGSHVVYAEAMIELIKQNSWTKLAILFSEDDIDTARFRAIQIRVNQSPNFEISFASAIYDNYIPLREIKDTFTRVILVLGTPGITLRTICLASHEHMVYPNYQWVFMERIDSDFHNVSFRYNGNYYHCPSSEISNALYNSVNFLFGAVGDDDNVQTVRDSNITLQEYHQEYRRHVEKYMIQFNVTSNEVDWAMGFYDAVWSLAFALNNSLEELNMNLSLVKPGSNIIAQTIGKHMVNLDFHGISGRIKFDSLTGYNLNTVDVNQYKQNITSTRIGVYIHSLTLFKEANPKFIDAEFESKHEHVNIIVAVILLVVTIFIMPVAIFLQIVSIVYRRHKPIKASSPLLNHLVFSGCYLIQVSAAVYVSTQIHEAITSVTRLYLCNVIPWLLSTGMTLIIGTVFVKTWRLHRIYAHSKKLKSKPISYMSNKLLGGIVIFLVFIDILVCIIWTSVDKLVVNENKEIRLMAGEELPIIIVNESCSSEFITYWILVLIAPKVALTLCSFFLALMTRFKMKEFRTSNIAILVYLITTLSGLMIPIYVIISFLDVEVTIRVTILCLFLDIMVYICVCLLFVSPTYALIKAKYLSG